MIRCKIILIVVILFAFVRSHAAPLFTIRFNFRFGTQAFMDGQTFTTIEGEKLTINRFQFYVSGINAITSIGDTIQLSTEYFLINVADSSSNIIRLKRPKSSIQKIIFTIGVDSVSNVSGIQTGSLDPSLGMFWTWRSGYIMAKMEGVSEQANTAGKRFTHDVGGFQYPYNTVRQIVLNILEQANLLTGITVDTDMQKWFNGKHSIKIANNPVCHTPGKLAMQLADNYATLFTLAETF